MFRALVGGVLLFLVACSGPSVQVVRQPGFQAPGHGQPLYVVPFETIMVPHEVSSVLFDRFVDHLNERGRGSGYDFVILKQGLDNVDPQWLAEHHYLVGELFAYVEDVGSSATSIKARSRLRLYQPGQAQPTLQLLYPTEIFFENDYSSLPQERQRLAEQVSAGLVDGLLQALSEP